jgi:hypothetical protein
LTQLPPTDTSYELTAFENESFILEGLKVALGQRFTCTDAFFSGHTIFFTIVMLTWYEYCPANTDDDKKQQDEEGDTTKRNSRLFYCPIDDKKLLFFCSFMRSFVLYSLSPFCILCVIATRFHYTIDVLFGFMVTFCLWDFYHERAIMKSKFLQRLEAPFHEEENFFLFEKEQEEEYFLLRTGSKFPSPRNSRKNGRKAAKHSDDDEAARESVVFVGHDSNGKKFSFLLQKSA